MKTNKTLKEILQYSTIYSVVKNGVENGAMTNKSIPEEFWFEAKKYASKALARNFEEEFLSKINKALLYNPDNSDLITDAVLKLSSKYEYLAKKYIELNNTYNEETKVIKKFNATVSTIIPSMIYDLYRHLSSEVELDEDTNVLSKQRENKSNNKKDKKNKRTIKVIKNTYNAVSLNKEINTHDDSYDTVELIELIPSKDVSVEDRAISKQAICDYLKIVSPKEAFSIMTKALGISADTIKSKLDNGHKSDFVHQICEEFACIYDIPEALTYVEALCKDDLDFGNTMSKTKRNLWNNRCSAWGKIGDYNNIK